MRIAVISDVSGPTNPAYPGHGLGQATHRIATGLLKRGHEVTLFAAKGSAFEGSMVCPTDAGVGYENEADLAKAAYRIHKGLAFDAFLDNSHTHVLSVLFLPRTVPVVNVYHDMWQAPQRCPVFMSTGQAAYMAEQYNLEWAQSARVIHNTVDAESFPFAPVADDPPYALFLGIVRDYKNPVLAIEACTLAGIPLKVAGPMPGMNNWMMGSSNAEYLGPVFGEQKIKLIQGASVFLQLGGHESFGLTTIEAGLCGVPVVALPSGGNVDTILYGCNGVFPGRTDARGIADAMKRAMQLDRGGCRGTALRFADLDSQVAQYEQALEDVANGVVW